MSKENNTVKPEKLLWMDVETTGLDEKKDDLLEVELRLTSMDASKVSDSRHWLVRPETKIADMPEWALKHHGSNGLLEEAIGAGMESWQLGVALEANVAAMAGQTGVVHVAGSNPTFDLGFLRRLSPSAFDCCHHQMLDVDSLRMAFETAGLDLPGQTPTDHRTSTCLDHDIRQYRSMLSSLRGGMPEDLADVWEQGARFQWDRHHVLHPHGSSNGVDDAFRRTTAAHNPYRSHEEDEL